MRKKIILSISIVGIMLLTFFCLGRIKSQEELALEKQLEILKEKQKMMDFKLSEVNAENYTVLKTTHIDELSMDAVEIEHNVTKCKIVLMICDDEDKAFNIAFKTMPTSNNGICHIMEHSVLCGSRKYNVKNPFFYLVKTSLCTFLNAMTANDMTMYPVSSANDKDFKNLMDVYLDSVFFPNIYTNSNILKQEGWHYEINNDKDDLKVNGVVYNEMKGANSDPADLIQTAIFKDLFNGTNYQYNYGGEAKEIITITQEEFENFHKKYYSPSNAFIYLYGLMDMNERLEFLQDNYLSLFDYVEVENEKFNINSVEPKDGVYYYDSDTNEKNKAYVSYNFLFKDDKNNLKYILNGILADILFYKEGSYIKDKLIEKGLCDDVDFLYEEGMQNGFFSIVAQNVNPDNKDKLISEIDNIIENLINNGIDEKVLAASLNAAYLNACEKDSGSYTNGVLYSIKSLGSYANGYGIDNFIKYQDSYDILFNEDLSKIDNIFTKRLKELFVESKKKCVTVLLPKKGYLQECEKELANILKDKKTKMLKLDKSSIIELIDDFEQFKEYTKNNDEDLNSLPKLSITDISREATLITSNQKEIYSKNVISTTENVGDLVYIGVDYKLPTKTEEFDEPDKFLTTMAIGLLGSLDTENYTYDELDTYIKTYTGGVSIGFSINDVQPIIRVSTKTKKENIDKAYEIINEILYNTKFDDKKRIKQKISECKLSSNNAILGYGNSAAVYRASAKHSYSSQLRDKMGIGNVAFNKFINDLNKIYDKKADIINKSFDLMLNKYINYDKMFLDCCMSEENYPLYEECTKNFLKNNVEFDNRNFDIDIDLSSILNFENYTRKFTMEAFVTNSNVNFVARSLAFDESLYNGHMLVLNNIIDYDYLTPKVRVEGGAYGSSMSLSRYGNLIFYSYSDPNFVDTDNVYKNINTFLKSMNMGSEELELNIIGAMKTIDTYPNPYSKHLRNLTYVLRDIDNEKLNELRLEILDTKIEDFDVYIDLFDKAFDKSEFCALVTSENEKIAKDKYKIVEKIEK